MKKIFNSILVIAAAAAVFASCQKNEVVPSTTKTVNFTATTVDTKAVFGTPEGLTYPTLWTSNDSKVKVSLNYAKPVDADVFPASDGKSATFSGEFKDDESGNYIFTAISPATAYYAVSSEKEDWTISIPTSQTPSATSVDEAAMILSAATATTDMTETIDLAFQHVTAYGVFNLTDLNLGGAVISSVTLTAEKPLAGRFYSYPASGDIEVNSGVNAITINTSSTENIWFACAPCDLGGTTLKVAVITDKGTYIKNASIPTGAFKFEAGVIGKFNIDMSGIAPDSGLAEGKYAILAKRAKGNYFFMTNDLGTTNTKHLQAVDSKLAALPETISTKPDNVWTVTKSGNGYIIANQDGKQISWSSDNSATLAENGKVLTAIPSDVQGAYNLSFEPGGLAKTRNLALNSDEKYNFFAFYESTQENDLFFVPATIVEPTYYSIKVAETSHGTVEVKEKAEAGETVTVTVTPEDGYQLATLTVNGTDISETKSFEMPAADVTIAASFEELTNRTTILDFSNKTTGHAAYKDSWTYEDWTVVYGANNNKGWSCVKMGGKSETLKDYNPCFIYNNKAISHSVAKITVEIPSGSLSKSGMSVNSWGVYVYSDKEMTTQVDYVAGGAISNSADSFDFVPSTGKTWSSGYYYKVIWDLANTTSTNGIVCVTKITLSEK